MELSGPTVSVVVGTRRVSCRISTLRIRAGGEVIGPNRSGKRGLA
jgi:hypothetical protein